MVLFAYWPGETILLYLSILSTVNTKQFVCLSDNMCVSVFSHYRAVVLVVE